MKKLSALHAILTGLGIGFPVTLLCMGAIGGVSPLLWEFSVWAAASALYGLLSWLVFQKMDSLAMPAALGVHCLGCAAVTVAAVWICGYVENIGQFVSAILPVFILVYLVVFAGVYGYTKLEEKQINRALEQK